MRDQPSIQQAELASIIERHTGTNGIHEIAIPSLSFVRRPIEKDLNYGVCRPSLCITAQGMKEVSVGMEDFRYGPGDYLVSSVDLPATSQLIETSLESPYLGLILELKTNEILEVLDKVNCKMKCIRK